MTAEIKSPTVTLRKTCPKCSQEITLTVKREHHGWAKGIAIKGAYKNHVRHCDPRTPRQIKHDQLQRAARLRDQYQTTITGYTHEVPA